MTILHRLGEISDNPILFHCVGHQSFDSTFFYLSFFQHHITMTQYKKEFPFPMLFPPVVPKNVLAEWLSVQNVPQFHCAGRYMYTVILTLMTS